MRKLERANYEEFFLDYLEGNLDAMEQIMLQDFLVNNPDLKEELDEMQLLFVEEDVVEIEKEKLQQIPFQTDFDEFSVAKLEGDLGPEEEFQFDQFLKSNIKYRKDFEIYQKTKLEADESIQYPYKEKLKKKGKRLFPLWYSGVGIAASVAILLSIWNQNVEFDSSSQIPNHKITRNIELPKIQTPEVTELKESGEINSIDTETVEVKPIEKKATVQPETQVERVVITPKDINTKVEERIVETPVLAKKTETVLLANSSLSNPKLLQSQRQKENPQVSNSGLAQLGMSWKSSKKASGSILLAVAKYGVDKLEEIAGKKVKVEKQYDSETETSRFSIKTRGIGFSTTIK